MNTVSTGVLGDSKGSLLGEYLLRRNGAPDVVGYLNLTKGGYSAINLGFATPVWSSSAKIAPFL